MLIDAFLQFMPLPECNPEQMLAIAPGQTDTTVFLTHCGTTAPSETIVTVICTLLPRSAVTANSCNLLGMIQALSVPSSMRTLRVVPAFHQSSQVSKLSLATT